MRVDFKVAIILFLATIPCAGAVAVAPEYLHLKGIALAITFWGGAGLTAALLIVALVVALRAEAKTPSKGHRLRMIAVAGMTVCGIGFLAFAILFFVQRPSEDDRPAGNQLHKPPSPVATQSSPPLANNPVPKSATTEATSEESARLIYDPRRGDIELLGKSGGIKIATVQKKESSYHTAIFSIYPIFIGKFVFYTSIGPFNISLTANTPSIYSLPGNDWTPMPFSILENTDRFVEIQIEPNSPANAISPMMTYGTEPIDLRLRFSRK
jgi:hypothetical protein